MEDIIQEYGKVLLAVLAGVVIMVVISLSWSVIGNSIMNLSNAIAGGYH